MQQRYPQLIYQQAPIYFPWSPLSSWYAIEPSKRPKILILAYLEVWPPWVYTWHHLGVKIIVVDGKLTTKTTKYSWILKPFFKKIHCFLAQSKEDQIKAQSLGVQQSLCFGFGKYDSIYASHLMDRAISIKGNHPKHFLLTIACLAQDEEQELLETLIFYYPLLQAKFGHISLCIAPRQIERTSILAQKLQKLALTEISLLDQHSHLYDRSGIHLVHCYGRLEEIYADSHYSLIAGSFGKRNGQNIIEALLQKSFVFVGSKSEKITQEKALLTQYKGLGLEINKMSLAMSYILENHPEVSTEIDIQQIIQNELLGASQKQEQAILQLYSNGQITK
jgi:3-deoxy-D-manno-octulosonic-acid transferase